MGVVSEDDTLSFGFGGLRRRLFRVGSGTDLLGGRKPSLTSTGVPVGTPSVSPSKRLPTLTALLFRSDPRLQPTDPATYSVPTPPCSTSTPFLTSRPLSLCFFFSITAHFRHHRLLRCLYPCVRLSPLFPLSPFLLRLSLLGVDVPRSYQRWMCSPHGRPCRPGRWDTETPWTWTWMSVWTSCRVPDTDTITAQ